MTATSCVVLVLVGLASACGVDPPGKNLDQDLKRDIVAPDMSQKIVAPDMNQKIVAPDMVQKPIDRNLLGQPNLGSPEVVAPERDSKVQKIVAPDMVQKIVAPDMVQKIVAPDMVQK